MPLYRTGKEYSGIVFKSLPKPLCLLPTYIKTLELNFLTFPLLLSPTFNMTEGTKRREGKQTKKTREGR